MPTTIDPSARLGDLVADLPARARALERLGIDYCCQGSRTLAAACATKGLAVDHVVAEIERALDRGPADRADQDWRATSMGALCDHIERKHHRYLRDALPFLRDLAAKVVAAHGERDARLREVEQVLQTLAEELYDHMLKEERILFPICRALDEASGPPRLHCGTVLNPIRVMLHEHDDAGRGLARMRALTDGYRVPEWGCPTLRVLFAGLADLEQDLHYHIHLENNLLFPRAARVESELTEGATARA